MKNAKKGAKMLIKLLQKQLTEHFQIAVVCLVDYPPLHHNL